MNTARPHPLRPTALEVAAGMMLDADRIGGDEIDSEEMRADAGSFEDPQTALEAAVIPALRRPPCVVMFSGGRDSSVILAAATLAARRDGLDPPVPVTYRYADAPSTEERYWQELVISHLDLAELSVIEVSDGDLVGAAAQAVIRRHGVLRPPNAFTVGPALAAAKGGSVLTGLGGDQVLGGWRWRTLADALAGRRVPGPHDVLRLGYAALPARVRLSRERRRAAAPGWMLPAPAHRVRALIARHAAQEPVMWRDWVVRRGRTRDLVSARWSIEVLANDAGVRIDHPLLSPRFLAAAARAGGRLGFGDRGRNMQAMFAKLLPEPVLTRTSKATFDEVSWSARSREFAQSWDGNGLDDSLVDPEAVRAVWLARPAEFQSAMLLQAAWLATHGGANAPSVKGVASRWNASSNDSSG